jgi:hypothetical protein
MPMTGDSWGKVIHTSDWEKIKSWPVCETASLLGAVPFGEWTARMVAHGDLESGVNVAGSDDARAGQHAG